MAALTTKNKTSRPPSNEYNSEVLDVSYQRWVNTQLDKRSLEYSDLHNISICCGTWNVNSKQLSDDCDLKDWLLAKGSPPADIYVIGLQEIVDLNMMNVMINSSTSDDSAMYWQRCILRALNETGVEFALLHEKHMVGLQFLIVARCSLMSTITDVRSAVVYTGTYGVTANKGGISIRFDLFDSPLCFICAHFHANRENIEARNLDFQTIYESTSFLPTSTKRPTSMNDAQDLRPFSVNFKAKKAASPLSVASHEHIFWLGNLNYRIEESIEVGEIFGIIDSGKWQSLRGRDQLNLERDRGNVFQNFEEGVLNFPPTYKFQPGTDVYERRPDKKLRAPAWCDRVLWKSANVDTIKQLSYKVAPLHISDHKPVSAWFECGVRKVIPEKAREVYQDLLFAVDKWINASTPKLTLDNRMFDFGTIELNKKYTQTINLTNSGTVMAEWKFVPKHDELMVSKQWLKFYPEDGILAPGETANITASIYYPTDWLLGEISEKKDNEGRVALEDIVILHVVNGSDFFCIFNGSLQEDVVNEIRKSAIRIDNPIRKHMATANKSGKKRSDAAYDSDEDDEPFSLGDVYKSSTDK